MKKFALILVTLLCAGTALPLPAPAESPFVENQPETEKVPEQPKRLIDKEEVDELSRQGYTTKEIFMGAIISQKANKNIKEVLSLYQKTKSWEKTAELLGVDTGEMKKTDTVRKWKQLTDQHSSTVISYLAKYSGKKEEDIKNLLNDGICLRFLVGAAAMAKLSGRKIDDIILFKQQGISYQEILDTINITNKDLQKELEKIRTGIEAELNKEL